MQRSANEQGQRLHNREADPLIDKIRKHTHTVRCKGQLMNKV